MTLYVTIEPIRYEEPVCGNGRWAGTWPTGTVVRCKRANDVLVYEVRHVDNQGQGRTAMRRQALRRMSPLEQLAYGIAE